MDKLTYKRVSQVLDKSANIGIIAPKDPNLDQMAAALSLYLSLLEAGKNVAIATPNDPLVEVSNLFGIDKVKTKLDYKSGDLVVSFPYKEGEVEKVSYTLEDNFLNIVVKAGDAGLSFDEKDVKFIRPQGAPELLFIVGAKNLTDLGKLFNPADFKDTTVINIDNSPDNQGFGDIVLATPAASSVCEIVSDYLISESFPMNLDIAQNLLWGIGFATNNFQDSKTTSSAFEIAGTLMKSGASRSGEFLEKASSVFSRSASFGSAQDKSSGQARPAQVPSLDQTRDKQERQTQPVQVQEETPGGSEKAKNPPEDWLAPKIYKGSTNFES